MQTLVFRPQAGTVAPADGRLIAGATGTGLSPRTLSELRSLVSARNVYMGGSGDDESWVELFADNSSYTNKFAWMSRSILCFDTSGIPDDATILSAKVSLFGTYKEIELGACTLHLCSASPSSFSNFALSDFSAMGSTSFGNISSTNFSTTAYNDILLNASGINHISKTGITAFGARLGWDLNNSFTGTWLNNRAAGLYWKSADATGENSDPLLTVIYEVRKNGFLPFLA